jgi:hypothetical protein
MRSDQLLKAKRFREEARRIRREAELFADELTRRQMLDIAAQYDKLAEKLESGQSC